MSETEFYSTKTVRFRSRIRRKTMCMGLRPKEHVNPCIYQASPSLNMKRDGYGHAFSGLRERARKMMPVAPRMSFVTPSGRSGVRSATEAPCIKTILCTSPESSRNSPLPCLARTPYVQQNLHGMAFPCTYTMKYRLLRCYGKCMYAKPTLDVYFHVHTVYVHTTELPITS